MKHFNIRVYGLWINKQQQILLSDERINDFTFTKFPGGGLEFGEGIHDCLVREWKEELAIDIEILAHFYTTDFFQISAFDHESQIISIYYMVKPITDFDIKTSEQIFDFKHEGSEEQSLRWIDLSQFTSNDLTLPIDKHVGDMICNIFKNESFMKLHS